MRLILAAIGVVLLGSSVAWAQTKKAPTAPATRAGVEAALTKEGRPIAPADVQAMGKDADLVLIDIVRDAQASAALRGRAIDALAASGSVVARDQLVRIVKPTQNEVELAMVRRALLGLGWLHDGRILANAGPWLEHDSAAVRLDAAVALALSKNPEGIEMLEKHNRREKDRDVKQKIQRLIDNNRPAQPAPKPVSKPRILPPPPLEGRDSTRF
ncbi:MAG: hypothetical protein SF187_00405 [Deltaproteobacteria bacterium]|nr:hypothetical protein [Deltaproteobacteria bacterium]